MKTAIMKIRPQFIDLVKKGIKKHEYRLATPERKELTVGSRIVLVSNQDKNNYVNVRITKIDNFSNWEDALSKFWEEDFKGKFNSLDDILKECYKFYSKDEVDKYGIIVYTIEKLTRKLKNSSFILDTNIIIQAESDNNVSKDITQVYQYFEKLGVYKYILSNKNEELCKYNDETRRNAILTKLNKYDFIPFTKINDELFTKSLMNYPFSNNSKVDNNILYELYLGNIDFVLTNDDEMIRKAKDLYLSDFVLNVSECLRMLKKEIPVLIDYEVLEIKKVKFSQIDIDDSFFDSLKEDYDGIKFINWFNNKTKQNEECYIYKENNKLLGFLYLKTEDESEDYSHFTKPFSKKKRLKVGTFKISKKGLRLGERFIKIIIDNALVRELDEIYVTLFDNKREEVIVLKKTFIEWGFEEYCENKNNGEKVLVKHLNGFDINKNVKANYPYCLEKPQRFFLPIFATYHTKLFPDSRVRNEILTGTKDFPGSYAIEKIYICNRYIKEFGRPGDEVLIYRMDESPWSKAYRSVVTGTAILEEVKQVNSLVELKKECKNKSVFTEKELDYFYNKKQYTTVIKLLYKDPLVHKVTLYELRELGIISNDSGPRIGDKISDENYLKIMERSGNYEKKKNSD